MALSVADLACTRAGRPVLAGLGFELAAGEALLLRGPNGAGKSTLLRALAGLLPATGRIELDGQPLDADTAPERVAYAGHLDAIKPQLTVAENLGFWSALLGGGAHRRRASPPSSSPPSPTARRTCSPPARSAASASPA